MRKKMPIKRGYFVWGDDDNAGLAVVAHSAREAKKIVYASGELEADWIDIRATWTRSANIEGLTIGIVDDAYDALRRRMYHHIEEGICDECGKDGWLYCHLGRALCDYCIPNTLLGMI